jgi:hypothetical protein
MGRDPGIHALEVTDEGRTWAALSYGSLLLGLPLGIIPVGQRKDAFALFHGKQSLVIAAEFLALFTMYMLGFAASFVAFFFTCGMSNLVTVPLLMLAMFLLLLPAIPAVHGLVLALNGQWEAPIGTFGLADRLFPNVTVEPPGLPDGPPGSG